VLLAVQRLILSPLSQFPGPQLAALTNWYEFYYDVVREGDFTAHIKDLHRKYGKTAVLPFTKSHVADSVD